MKRYDLQCFAAGALVFFWIAMIASGAGTPHGWITRADNGYPVQGDYTGIYTAGELTLQGTPAKAYDWEAHKAAQRTLTHEPKSSFYPWPYPPPFLFVAAALALLPYVPSMLVWTFASLAAFAAALARLTPSWRDFLFMLAAPAAWLNFYIGQNGALTGTLLAFGLIVLRSKPILAGTLFGLLSYKPHLGLLLPVALMAGGHWKSAISATCTVLGLALASALAFGLDPFLAFPQQLDRVLALVNNATEIKRLQSIYALTRTLGGSADAAMALQLAATVGLIALIAWTWRSPNYSDSLKAAALAAAMTLASPYQFVYDLVILTVAQAFFLRHLAETSQNPSALDIGGLVAANVCIFWFANTAIPLGVVGSLMVLALILRQMTLHRVVSPITTARSAPENSQATA